MASIRVPPHDEDAEKSILGAILIDKDAIVDIAVILRPEMFYNESNGKIYEAMETLYENRDPIDALTVANWLKEKKQLEKIGGRSYMAALSNTVPVASHAEKYAQIVREKYIKRMLISAGGQMGELAFDEGKPLGEILDRAEQSIYALSQTHVKRSFIPIKDALAESFDRLDSLHGSVDGLRGVPTGFTDLDNMLAGMQDSNLIILAARPGIGKTTFATNIAQFAAVEKKMPVGYFALEMSNLEMVDRMLVGQANIDAWKLKTGNLKDDDFARLSEAMGVLADAPLFIDDTPGQTILELRTKARRLHSQVGLKLLVVDYLQLCVGDRSYESRVTEVGSISQGLKNLARELRIPVLALSQLNRGVENRNDKTPQLADLRESGCLLGDTLIMRRDTGMRVKISDLVGQENVPIWAMNKEMKMVPAIFSKVFSSGRKKVYEMILKSGRIIRASGNHPFLKVDDWARLDTLKSGDRVAIANVDTNGNLLDHDLDWDGVKSIRELGVFEVFDATVPEHSCFLANDIVVHNSIEQDADVVMFLYRDNDEAMEDVKLAIAKHRNGGLGVVNLKFRGDRVKFYGLEKTR